MASMGLDLGDDDVHAAELATCVRAARVHCVVHSGGDLHAIHTAVRVMLGAARTRTMASRDGQRCTLDLRPPC